MTKPTITVNSILGRLSGKCMLALASVVLAGGAVSLYAVTQAPQDVTEGSTVAEGATPAEDGPTLDKASELYKSLKQLQFDGADEEEIYETAYKTFETAFAILSTDTVSDASADQCRGMLLDLNNSMARGAIHYSMKGDNTNMSRFARAYVDTQMMPQMSGAEFKRDPELYPALVYCAASGSYNAGNVDDAIKYFEVYLRTGEQKQREQVALFYGQSILKTNQQQRGLDALVAAANEYPANLNILTIAMQLCLDTQRRDLLPPLVERALTFKPNDEKLLNLQAQIYEDQGEYRPALDIYMRLEEAHPNSMSINECIARCYYNLGTGYYNESIMAMNDKDASKSRRQSNAYFSSAADKFEELLANDANNVKYLKALATSYACLGNKSKVDALNVQLSALGQAPMAMNTMPVVMGDPKAGASKGPREIPSYQDYAQSFVTSEITKWAQRGEFEKVDDYMKRVAPDKIRKEQERLSAITADKYLQEYASHLVLSELKLQPYDVENETYAINSDFGQVTVKVPLKNKEAEAFKSTWDQVQLRNAKFYIKDDKIAISTITFHSPNGKDYTYNASDALAYGPPPVVGVDPNLLSDLTKPKEPKKADGANPVQPKPKAPQVESDVDKNIPVTKSVNANTIAMIIANEHYNKVTEVASAEHDGEVFAQYCRETLGIPANQVLLFKNVTYGNTLSAMNQLKNSVQALGPGTDVIVYYAGHGVPDEKTSEAYMLPTDADPMVIATAYPLSQFYNDLNAMGAANVMVFMDACFSGANRGDGMLAEARGVVLKAKSAAPKGNMFVLSAADGNETALPWKEKNHGLFTYYLLKKLQESKGNASLKEIADYVSTEVKKTASLQLNKPQSPKVNVSGALAGELDKKKLKK